MGEYKYQTDSKPPTEKWLYKSEVKKKINKFEWYEKETFNEKKGMGFFFTTLDSYKQRSYYRMITPFVKELKVFIAANKYLYDTSLG